MVQRRARTDPLPRSLQRLVKPCIEDGERMTGTVYLIGAGPGDPDLITVKGMEILRRADVVIYDRLAPPELLREARADAE
ncbi:SAM-dependent methyltransferase, partial [Salmonella sp. SAL4433]|uniref:SAM-dependent methyltransferase n=1 Tax=Salmonella sp. SAL4433 TaxID=3159888 RepID=UPI00397D8870